MIVADDRIMGGAPCVADTRIPVVTIVHMLVAYDLDPSPMLFEFSQLNRADIVDAVAFAADQVSRRYDPTPPRWLRMSVGELLDHGGDVVGLRNPDGTARAFVLKATPAVVQLIEDLTIRADVPPAADS